MVSFFLSVCALYSQQQGYNAYEFSIDGSFNFPRFTVKNTSTNGNTIKTIIIRFKTVQAKAKYKWDLANTGSDADLIKPALGTASFGSSTNNEDEVTVNYTGFDQGEEAQFSADIDFQTGNNQPDITNVLFGDPSDSTLGPAELVVYFAEGETTKQVVENDFDRNKSVKLGSNFVRYEENFDNYGDGTKSLKFGTRLTGGQARVLNGKLRLTQDGKKAGFSTFAIPPLNGSSQGFTATFDYYLADGSGNNVPADGFSFNYTDAALGVRGSAEEGISDSEASNNLSFQVDTWRNSSNDEGVSITTKRNNNDRVRANTVGYPISDGQSKNGTVTIEYSPNKASFNTTGLNVNANFNDIDLGELNNAQAPNAFVPNDNYNFIISARVGGATETLDIDNLKITSTQGSPKYTFAGPENPLKIRSVFRSGGGELKVNEGVNIDIQGQAKRKMLDFNQNPQGFDVPNGTDVSITIPEYIYFNDQGALISGTDFANASYRYTPATITGADELQSGDSNTYRFKMSGPTDLQISWKKEWAINVQNVFTETSSNLKQGGNPWAGPMKEGSDPNPVLTSDQINVSGGKGKYFILDSKTFKYSVDGAVADPIRVDYPIRYVTKNYKILKSDGSTELDAAFASNVTRQSTAQFTADQQKTIQIFWKIQYGIQQTTVDAAKSSAPIVANLNGDQVFLDGSGTYWVDPRGDYFVGTRQFITLPNQPKRQISGWVSGDKYYFESFGAIGDATFNKTSANGQVNLPGYQEGLTSTGQTSATWKKLKTIKGIDYAGYEIKNIERPITAQWQYGQLMIDETTIVGDYAFESGSNKFRLSNFTENEPTNIKVFSNDSPNNTGQVDLPSTDTTIRPSPERAFKWDPVNKRLYPMWAGNTFSTDFKYKMDWESNDGLKYQVNITVKWPTEAHYPHVVDSPGINLDPDPNDSFRFNDIIHTNCKAEVDENDIFKSPEPGISVLSFAKLARVNRGPPSEALALRVVKTTAMSDVTETETVDAFVGSTISDAFDEAGLNSGYIVQTSPSGDQNVGSALNGDYRINPFIYDQSKWDGINPNNLYSDRYTSNVLISGSGSLLPGPIIPVNIGGENIQICWFQNPKENDGLLWPNKIRKYNINWPTDANTKRIVIASQYGSESLGVDGKNQHVVGNSASDPVTYDPSRFQDVTLYHQEDKTKVGYNPNEEHALIVPSFRYADVSPRPPAAYALREGDLNVWDSQNNNINNSTISGYTSVPRVLVSFYDSVDGTYKMNVYKIIKECIQENWTASTLNIDIKTHQFATAANLEDQVSNSAALFSYPHIKMNAGEPIIPFYPLADVIGAAPLKETFGGNIHINGESNKQVTYWEDKNQSSWSISGGDKAWFKMYFHYPLLVDFWWPSSTSVRYVQADLSGTSSPTIPELGGAIPFLPTDHTSNDVKKAAPQPILYKSEWPDSAPVLKAGETLTFSGGEFKADNPTLKAVNSDGELIDVETEGLPGIVGFASAEVVFDSLNPSKIANKFSTHWTAGVIEPLKVIKKTIDSFPSSLLPDTKKTYVSEGKYVFDGLSASLKKRFRYDPLKKQLEFFGYLNDKKLGDSSLTASPSAVYVLEPNILLDGEKNELLALSSNQSWKEAINSLYNLTRHGLGSGVPQSLLGPGLALVPNEDFLDPSSSFTENISWITLVENNHNTLKGSPVTPHIIKVDRTQRFRGSIKTILSDNVFDENINLQHTGEFGAQANNLFFEWWYRIDDGSLNVPPPDKIKSGQSNPWKIYPDQSGNKGKGRFKITLEGTPNAPEALLSDTFWFCRYRHKNEKPEDSISWNPYKVNQQLKAEPINFDWAGAGNSQPFVDADLDGYMDYRPQLVMGWLKRVMDRVNPYEARINDFTGDSPSTVVSMLAQFGPRFEGPVALNPDKNVIENVGLIELYRTLFERAKDLSIDLSRPISTPGIANALQLASTRLSDFYNILGNEAYADALDPTIGFGSDSVDYGSLAPAIHAFQNQTSGLLDEELALLRGVDDYYARPVYNRLFWNFTKAEGEAAYAMNYNLSDVNLDGFINEDDAMLSYPQGHGDAWGHYLSAVKHTYDLLNHPYFNWVSRSESYNLNDIVIGVDFLDERKFAATAAAKAKAGKEIVDSTYKSKYVEDPDSQWQGYTDTNEDRAWGVQGWARRAAQGAYFDWVTSCALLPSDHPNENLEGIQKVDRKSNSDIKVISANLNSIQSTFDNVNKGFNPLGIPNGDSVVMDFDPTFTEVSSGIQGELHFEQLYARAVKALEAATAIWDYANEPRNMVRQVSATEEEFRNDAFQEDLSYKNELISIFGKPYEGTIGPGKFYPEGYDGPDLALYMYVNKNVREITNDTVPLPTKGYAEFNTLTKQEQSRLDTLNAKLEDALTEDEKKEKEDINRKMNSIINQEGINYFRNAWEEGFQADGGLSADAAAFWTSGITLTEANETKTSLKNAPAGMLEKFAPTFYGEYDADGKPIHGSTNAEKKDGYWNVNYTDLVSPKVDLVNFKENMPVTAAGYTFAARDDWGNRSAVGELQMIITQMIQKEAEVAEAIAAWDALTGETLRQMHVYNSLRFTGATKKQNTVNLARTQRGVETLMNVVKLIRQATKTTKELTVTGWEALEEGTPLNLPTVGFSVSPGDALSLMRAGATIGKGSSSAVLNGIDLAIATADLAQQEVFNWINMEVGFLNDQIDRDQNKREQLKEVEDLLGDESILRVGVFKEMQGLRELSDQYNTLIDEGSRLVDERQAFNKRMAASVQKARYQDINFRYSRNHSLQNYRSAFDLASRYAYMAGKAYEYSTNLPTNNEGSVLPLLQDIVRARGIGHFDGEPRIGKGGLSEALAKMKANFDTLKGQLGINNTQMEFSNVSLREEHMRIYPKDGSGPANNAETTEASNIGINGTAANANQLWKEALINAKVDDLWDVREYRNKCKPIASRYDANGNSIAEPGLVIRFSTEISVGKNFFGKPLAGGDHTFDPSNFTTKIRALGVNLVDYQSSNLLTGLSDSPRIYLVPSGSDMMGYASLGPPDASNPDTYRAWNIVDQKLPIPYKASTSTLDRSNYNPIIDNINDRYGDTRRFSAFRAHHSSTGEGAEDDMVYDSRLVGRSVWNTEWVLIIPGRSLNYDGNEGITRLINQISDIELYFDTYGMSGE